MQLKDPQTYFDVTTLGQELTEGDEQPIWNDIKANQQKILADKRIKHRNFGTYSKHLCGYDTCAANGLMIRQGTFFHMAACTSNLTKINTLPGISHLDEKQIEKEKSRSYRKSFRMKCQ